MDFNSGEYKTYLNSMASDVPLSSTETYYQRIAKEMHPLMTEEEFEKHLKELERQAKEGKRKYGIKKPAY